MESVVTRERYNAAVVHCLEADRALFHACALTESGHSETVTLNASFDGSRILVYGELGPIQLADYEIEKPRSAVVLSVEDRAIMEFQLYFKKLG